MNGQASRRASVCCWGLCLKLQPYVQSSVAHRANHKLAFRFFGPYRILARLGKVAYLLQLPDDATVNPVFHVSQLKQSSFWLGWVSGSHASPTALLYWRRTTCGASSSGMVSHAGFARHLGVCGVALAHAGLGARRFSRLGECQQRCWRNDNRCAVQAAEAGFDEDGVPEAAAQPSLGGALKLSSRFTSP